MGNSLIKNCKIKIENDNLLLKIINFVGKKCNDFTIDDGHFVFIVNGNILNGGFIGMDDWIVRFEESILPEVEPDHFINTGGAWVKTRNNHRKTKTKDKIIKDCKIHPHTVEEMMTIIKIVKKVKKTKSKSKNT